MPGEERREPPTAFAVDTMLGRLARWLRILGHDVAYGPHLHGPALVRRARDDGRLLLTRDSRLVRRRGLPRHVVIRSDHFRDQLRQVADTVGVGAGFLGRCLECNGRLEPVAREDVRDRVPSYVFETQAAFLGCPRCHRLYWAATHREHMRHELETLGLAAAVEA